jgi:hypothetical protein
MSLSLPAGTIMMPWIERICAGASLLGGTAATVAMTMIVTIREDRMKKMSLMIASIVEGEIETETETETEIETESRTTR